MCYDCEAASWFDHKLVFWWWLLWKVTQLSPLMIYNLI